MKNQKNTQKNIQKTKRKNYYTDMSNMPKNF